MMLIQDTFWGGHDAEIETPKVAWNASVTFLRLDLSNRDWSLDFTKQDGGVWGGA